MTHNNTESQAVQNVYELRTRTEGRDSQSVALADREQVCLDSLEEWRPVVGWEGFYEVSSLGRVRNVERVIERPPKGPWIQKTRILKQQRTTEGYLSIALTVDGERRTFGVHRLVALAFIPNPDNKPEVNHKRGDKKDNRYWMLEWATRKEQIDHAMNVLGHVYGHSMPGEENYFAKLGESEVLEIKRLLDGGIPQRAIAERFGVHYSTISCIKLGRSWAHLQKAA